MSKPTADHWQAVKDVLLCVAGTVGVGIVFTAKSGAGALHGYCDSDYAACVDTRRSITGYAFLNAGGTASWFSRLQLTVSTSTAEAEYMSSAAAVKEALWYRYLAQDLQLGVSSVPIKCDNQAAIRLVNNPITSARVKHIDVQHHFVRQRAVRGAGVRKEKKDDCSMEGDPQQHCEPKQHKSQPPTQIHDVGTKQVVGAAKVHQCR